MKPYIILEIANTHAGDKNYVFRLLEEYKQYTNSFGVKFQPFKYDEIARDDYEWFPVYKTLFFSEEVWAKIILKASETKDVWLDVSNQYSITILNNNLSRIKGIKFQSSILENIQLIEALKLVDLSQKAVIINVASLSIEKIKHHIVIIKEFLNPAKIYLQIGFQDYPTRLEDSGLSKIKSLNETFKLSISFADHIARQDEMAIELPALAYIRGAELIEKHVMCSGEPAKYDHYSSVTPDVFSRLVAKLNSYAELLQQPFLNKREINYYSKTVMIPIVSRELNRGQLVSFVSDVNFKRTNENGLNLEEVKEFQKSYHLLKNSKAAGSVLQKSDFKRAKIATIIAGRLKSKRLPKKAIRKINGKISTVELCIRNCKFIKTVDYTILATSDLPEDAELKNYTYDKSVIFHTGDAEDVIERYLSIINQLNIDVFIRVTADMPYVSYEIVEILLHSHFDTGADYTAPKNATIGQGVQIINASALRKVRELFPVSNFSEYMNAYIIYNPQLFKINEIDLPESYIRPYRLTIDYPKDLELVEAIERYYEESKISYSLNSLFKYLDANPDIVALNNDLTLIYKTNPDLVAEIKQRTTYVGEH